MEKQITAFDDASTSSYNPVFIDTSLDTHLALIVSPFDTVSDLKKKLINEHPLCFPDIGGINIHALKVKRRGFFYHLSDSMFLTSAFQGVRKSWFLFVEASSAGEQSGRHASIEILKSDHLLTTNTHGKKRKGEKTSSKSVSQVVAMVPSFTGDDIRESSLPSAGFRMDLEREPDVAVVPEENVQDAMASGSSSILKEHSRAAVHEEGETDKLTIKSDGDGHATDAVNVQIKSNTTKAAAVYAVENVRVSEYHHDIATETNCPLPVQEADDHNKDKISRNEDVIVNNGQRLGNNWIPVVAEEGELTQKDDANAMPSAKCTVPSRDEMGMNSKVVVTTDLSDANGSLEPRKSSKRRKKRKHTGTSVREHTTSSSLGFSSPKPHKPAHLDQSSDKSIEGKILSSTVGKEESKTTLDISILGTEFETDNVIHNVLESLQDTSKNSVDAENGHEISRKKTKRKRDSAAENLLERQMEDKDFSCKNATPSINNTIEVKLDASSKSKKKTKLGKIMTGTHHQLNGSSREPQNKVEIDTALEGISKGMPIQDGNFLKPGCTDEANNHAVVSCKSDRTIVNDNFVPSQQQHEIIAPDRMLVDNVSKTEGTDKEIKKAGQDEKKLGAQSNGSSPGIRSSLKLNENEGSGAKAQSSTLHAKRKIPKVSGIRANDPDKDDREPEEATRTHAVNASGMLGRLNKNKEVIAASRAGLRSSENLILSAERGGHQSRVEKRIVSRTNDNGEVVDSSKLKKSLLAKSGTIFKDDSDGSSDDKGRVDKNSDSHTNAPSDNSLSSTYSDGVSTAEVNASLSSQRKKSARSTAIKEKLDTIMRRTDIYKASKLTASQLQLQESESQPVEFVPDSQGNP